MTLVNEIDAKNVAMQSVKRLLPVYTVLLVFPLHLQKMYWHPLQNCICASIERLDLETAAVAVRSQVPKYHTITCSCKFIEVWHFNLVPHFYPNQSAKLNNY